MPVNTPLTSTIFSPPSVRATVVLVLGVALSASVSAQSLRCKGDFAQIGNSKGTVLQKCGEPVLKDSFCKPVTQTTTNTSATPDARGATTSITINQCVNVDEWTYNPGYGQFMTMLQFEAGELKSIRYGDRVTR
jgi:hypothetical protein